MLDLKPCPQCGEVPEIGYACGEYFILPISRAVGESRKPLIYYVISVFVNFVLDIILVKHLGLGVEGAAVATLISYFVAALLTGIYIIFINL